LFERVPAERLTALEAGCGAHKRWVKGEHILHPDRVVFEEMSDALKVGRHENPQ
jgi:hypothetical protein